LILVYVSVGALVRQVGEVLGRAHSLFGTPAVGQGLGAGSGLAGAGSLVRGGAAQMNALSGVLPASYGVFAADAGPTLDHAAGADGALNGHLSTAATSDASGHTTSGAVLTAASTDTSTLAPVSGTPGGQRALVAALRARVAEQAQVVNAYRQRDARLAAMLRNLHYSRRNDRNPLGSMPFSGLGGGRGDRSGFGRLASPLGTLASSVHPSTSAGLPAAGAGAGMPLGLLTPDSSKRKVVAAIIGEAHRRGYSPYQTTAIISDCLQESGANPRAQSPNGLWYGPFQQDTSYRGRRNPNLAIQEFFDRLDHHGGPRSPDIWKSIFWLQQRPGDSSAEAAVANGRAGYLTEIRSRHGEAQQLYRDIVASPAAGGSGVVV
jgi:hypothetical protein